MITILISCSRIHNISGLFLGHTTPWCYAFTMTLFTQKWTIVSFISPVPEGFEFSYKNWPRHITMVDVFFH